MALTERNMLKRLVLLSFFAIGLFGFSTPGIAAVASVDYVHATILELKDVTVTPQIAGGGTNYTIPVSLKYFMRQIDKANELLNGTATTDYAGALTTAQETNLVEVNRARADIEALIEGPSAPDGFIVHLSNISGLYSFMMSASGNFTVDWGDGSPIQTITKTNTTETTYSHSYSPSGNYDIVIGGLATGYTTDEYTSVISLRDADWSENTKMTGISGSIGNIFPTLGNTNGQQPRFYYTFYGCVGLTTIPYDLFSGISGAPASSMFEGTFSSCSGLTGAIPAGLFSGISGAPASGMFSGTFSYCTGLNGSIPTNLFSGISGAPADGMFGGTFSGCSGLTGSIPSNLFSGISGAPAAYMFQQTFGYCTGLTGAIPTNLFSGISGAPAYGMFSVTFNGCSGLTGSIPSNLFSGISGAPADGMFGSTFGYCTGLTGSIPTNLFSGISGAPAYGMFSGTFYHCSELAGAIPAGLFGTISGTPAELMFQNTFSYCSGLTGAIPAGLFGTISGAPANGMFAGTFEGCSGLTGIDDGIWDLTGLTNTNISNAFYQTFSDCNNITTTPPTIAFGNTTNLWEHFTAMTNQNTFSNATQMVGYASIPSDWK